MPLLNLIYLLRNMFPDRGSHAGKKKKPKNRSSVRWENYINHDIVGKKYGKVHVTV